MQPQAAADSTGDVWRQHEDAIRKLYQEDRRTLEEVKRLMEAAGFPATPLWAWETKLRDLLGLRKKAKKDDWPLLYQHIYHRLLRPDRKTFKKPTVLYFNGTEYPWDRAWKEIRRQGIPALPPNQELLGHLPPEFIVRTPPPSPAPPTSPTLPMEHQSIPDVESRHLSMPSPTKKRHAYFDQDASCALSLPSVKRQKCIENSALTRIPMPIQRQLNSLVAQLSSVTSMTSSLSHEQMSPTEHAASVYRLCLESIPWIDVVNEVHRMFFTQYGSTCPDHHAALDIVTGKSSAFGENDAISDYFSSIGGFILPFEMQSSASPSSSGPVARRQSHNEACTRTQGPDALQHLCIAIYLLSNNFLVEEHVDIESLSAIIQTIWDTVPHNILLALFKKNLPSVATAWKTLLKCAKVCRHTAFFKTLISIGLQESLFDKKVEGHDHLFHAARLGYEDTVSDLVDYGCSVELGWYSQDESAIVAALDYCSLDCAKLLIDTCDVNEKIYLPIKKSFSTNFLLFIENFEPNNRRHVAALKYFLSRGANAQSFVMPDKWNRAIEFYEASTNLPQLWRPAVSDYLLYKHTSTFKKMFLKMWDQDPTAMRAGILCAAEQGLCELKSFLAKTNFLESEKFLQMVLAELFLLNLTKGVNLRVVLSLVRYGVDIGLPLLSDEVPVLDLMYEAIRQAKVEGLHHGWKQVLKTLLDKGAIVGSRALRQAVQDRGCVILSFLGVCGVDLGTKGAAALVQAARLNNTEAVLLLLDAGVDINSTIRVGEDRLSIIAMSLVEWQLHAEGYSRRLSATSCATLQLLLDKGADPRFNEYKPQSWRLIQVLFAVGSGELRAKVRFLLDNCVDFRDSRCPSARLLEDCLRGPQYAGSNEERMEVFRDLLERGAKIGPGSPLALLIHCDGGDDLIQRLLLDGADVDAYTSQSQERMDMPSCISPLQAAALKGRYGIFRQLLDMGASVNGRARGFKGMTAIQAVCSWDTKTTEERCRKIDMLQRLINCNADVNGAPAKHWGCTALQITALQGDLEIAAMLLTHGANVNAPPCNKNDGFMALDGAAELGRLDMVKFLLNANALSLRRGRDGYEGARRAAEENGHFAVVEIIDKHAEFNSLCGTKNPLQFLPRQSRKEAYDELDSEVDDSDLETESDTAMELDQVSDAEQFEDDISDWESDFSEAQEVPSTKDLIDLESVGRHEDVPFQSYSGLLDSSEFSDDE